MGQFAAALLEELGYSTTWAHDAQTALALVEEKGESFDAIFSDVVMPGMPDVEHAQQVRESRPSMPIILTRGYSHVLAQETNHGFELLQKPYSADRLARVLGKALGREVPKLCKGCDRLIRRSGVCSDILKRQDTDLRFMRACTYQRQRL